MFSSVLTVSIISFTKPVYYLIKTLDNTEALDMIKLDVLSMLEKHNKSKYWLWKQLGMSYQNFNRMVNNETKSIKYETLDAMCGIFGCTPNDLLLYDEDR